uniref:phosphoglycerate mutase (2,3-diphosphoglycerate-independent) n=1 Tax=Hemiscolopendra marginata TaxID=943146 RepID=A0A646QEE1_9MYRI
MSVCLIVIDGWGVSEQKEGNAILNATTPVMDALCSAPGQSVTLDASGLSVGLPAGLMGNSEVGHMNIGAGRVVYQDIVEINMSVENKSIYKNKYFVAACNNAKSSTGRLHLLGLISDGGVHAHINHLFALLEAAKIEGVPNTYVHFFADGRDTSPTSGVTYIQQVLDHLNKNQYGKLATIMGRYYAMDRDKREERIKLAYEGMVQGKGEKTSPDQVIKLVESRYNAEGDKRQTDEFLTPIIVSEDGIINDKDTLVFINFRADRMRQISEAFGITRRFETDKVAQNLHISCMTEYKKEYPFPLLFPPSQPDNVLAEWISKKGLPQFHCAETEKYAHVTFFFNGGREQAFELEDRLMVPSPRVATYDLQPEMSCAGVADEMVKALASGKYPFVMCNFAPPDMVGHTGVYEATVTAVQATDAVIGRVKEACEKHGYTLLVTADHGNAERMIDEKGGPVTSHSTNRVPFVMTGFRRFRNLTHNAALCDVAPTVLDLMGLDIPKEMGGQSLLAPV